MVPISDSFLTEMRTSSHHFIVSQSPSKLPPDPIALSVPSIEVHYESILEPRFAHRISEKGNRVPKRPVFSHVHSALTISPA